MKTIPASLFEKEGITYFEGVAVEKGDYIKIHGVAWRVLSGGRSPGKKQAPFLWVRNERYGTAIFSPSLDPESPHRSPRPAEKEFVRPAAPVRDWDARTLASLALAI